MKARIFSLVAALILMPALLFAVPVVITWDWMLDDPAVTHFRYQLDGEDADGWTVVDAMTTSYTAEDLDGSVEHTLYVQQSYDGIHYSESALSVAEPVDAGEVLLGSFEEEFYDDAAFEDEADFFVAEAEEAEVVEAQEEVIAEAESVEELVPVVSEEVKVKKERHSNYYTTITLGGSFSNDFNKKMAQYHAYNLSVGLGVDFNNLISFNRAIGLGLSVEANYAPYLDGSVGWKQTLSHVKKFKVKDALSGFDHAMDASAALMINMNSSRIAFDLGAGGFILWGPQLVDESGDNLRAGVMAKASLAYRFTDAFSMGVSGRYGVVLSEGGVGGDFFDLPMFADGRLFLGFSF